MQPTSPTASRRPEPPKDELAEYQNQEFARLLVAKQAENAKQKEHDTAHVQDAKRQKQDPVELAIKAREELQATKASEGRSEPPRKSLLDQMASWLSRR